MPAATAKPTLPPAPAAQRFCRQCQCYKAFTAFPTKRLSSLCNTCTQHNRELAESRKIDPGQDDRIAAMRTELGPTERVEIDLPGTEAWVQQYIAAHGGIEGAMNRLLAQLDWAEKNKPGSKVVFDIHQFFIKLHFAINVAKQQRERDESPLNLFSAFTAIEELKDKYMPQLNKLSEAAAKALGEDVEAGSFDLTDTSAVR